VAKGSMELRVLPGANLGKPELLEQARSLRTGEVGRGEHREIPPAFA
jgi:hypothetical protein